MDKQVLDAMDYPSHDNRQGRIAWMGCANMDMEQKTQQNTHNMILVFKTPNPAEINHIA